MSDNDGDEKQSRHTVRINICIRRTLILVLHWHTDLPKTCKKTMWEWSQNKDGNIIIRRQIYKIVMSDNDGDEKRSQWTMPFSVYTH